MSRTRYRTRRRNGRLIPPQVRAVHSMTDGDDVVGRLRVVGVRVERAPGRVAAAVSLGYDGGVVIGRADRAAAESQIAQVAGEATLDAVRQVAPGHTSWVLKQITVQSLLAGQAVVAHVLLETEGSPEHLIGSALSRSGPLEDAAAEAVLNAVERRLGWFVKR